MRIYADPELPDLVADWRDFYDCADDVGDVHVELRTPSTDELRFEATAPCTEGRITIPDVERERYRVVGYLLDRTGAIYNAASTEADLRNGLSERVDLWWPGYANLVVAWQFSDGGTCASHGAEVVLVDEVRDGIPGFQVLTAFRCTDTSAWMTAMPGRLQLRLRALGMPGTIAISEPTPLLEIAESTRTDAGTLVLAPCFADCPQPGR